MLILLTKRCCDCACAVDNLLTCAIINCVTSLRPCAKLQSWPARILTRKGRLATLYGPVYGETIYCLQIETRLAACISLLAAALPRHQIRTLLGFQEPSRMATSSLVRAPPTSSSNPSNKARHVKRSHSLLMHSKPPPVGKERASSLKREQSLKGPRDHYTLHLVSCFITIL